MTATSCSADCNEFSHLRDRKVRLSFCAGRQRKCRAARVCLAGTSRTNATSTRREAEPAPTGVSEREISERVVGAQEQVIDGQRTQV
jgi:hypothetical protein